MTGTIFFQEIRTNPLPGILFLVASVWVLVYLGRYIHYLAHFLEWFILVLEIPKVLKLPLLDNKDVYRYPAMAFYFYFCFAAIWDIGDRLDRIWGRRLVFTDKSIYCEIGSIFQKKVKKFPSFTDNPQLTWEWKRGLWRDGLGMNRLILKLGDDEVFQSGYFFPFTKNNKKWIQSYLRDR